MCMSSFVYSSRPLGCTLCQGRESSGSERKVRNSYQTMITKSGGGYSRLGRLKLRLGFKYARVVMRVDRR